MNSDIQFVKVELEFTVRFKELSNGWVEASSRYGSTTSYSKEDCVRILSDRARGIV
jgi:hypothetical protein